MSSIVTSILSSTVGLFWNKIRDTTADRLKDGDVANEKIREIIVRDMDDIKSKLDGLTRKDLRSSYNFLQEGVDFLNVSLQKSKIDQKALTNETQDDRGETSTMPSCGQSEILREAIELSQAMGKLKCSSNNEYESAKERFKDARKKATEAFSTETLVLKDIIFAAKLRIVSEMLECLDKPETAITRCLSFLKNFHSSPAIQEMFSVYLDRRVKSMLNKSERVENVKSVMLINYVLFQYLLKFSSKCWHELVLSMPTIDLPERSFSPIADWQEVATRKSMGNELTQPPGSARRVLIDKQFYSFDPFVSAVNGHGDVIACGDKRSDEIVVISSKTGECKVVKLPKPREGEFIKRYIVGLTVDKNNNVYVVVCLEKSVGVTSLVYILDENYHVKHDPWPLDFLKTSMAVNIAVNNNNNIIIISNPHVYICNDTGKLKQPLEHDSGCSLPGSLCISEQNEIITSSYFDSALVTFYEEGDLKSKVKLPEGHLMCGVAYHYVVRKIIVLSHFKKNNSCFLLTFKEDGNLETSTFLSEKTAENSYGKITSHPSGPVALVKEKTITFI